MTPQITPNIMKNKIAALCIMLIAFGQLRAQSATDEIFTDSTTVDKIKIQQMNRLGLLDDTRSDLIKKCLNLLAESIADDDKEKVYNLKEYALTLEDSVYLPLAPRELWCIDLYLNRFDDFLNDVVALDSARDAELGPKIIFNTNLYYVAHSKVFENLDAIKQTAHADSRLSETDKDFIYVFLKQFETKSGNYIKTMNRESDKFLENHPGSKYDYYVKRNLAYKFTKDFEGMFLDVSMGPGGCLLSGGITDWFETCKGAFQCDIAVGYKRWEVSWQFVGLFGNIPKKDISFSNEAVWEKGESSNVATSQFCIGRLFPLNEKWVFIPRVGLGYTAFYSPYDHDNKDNPLNDQQLTSIMPTIGAEIRYEKFFLDNYQGCFWSPILRLSVQPVRTKIEETVTYGAITTLSAVFKIGLCDKKRAY